MMKRDLSARLLYGLLVGIFTWYATLLPLVLTGTWRNKLIPSLGMITEWPHLTLLIAIWVFGASRRMTLVAAIILACFIFGVVAIFLGGDPGRSVLVKAGWVAYLAEWSTTVLPSFLAPAVAASLLINADQIAPKILKNWRPVYD